MKIRLVAFELFRADRRTEKQRDGSIAMTKLLVTFSQFCERVYKVTPLLISHIA